MSKFHPPRHLPPEFRVLPLDLLRAQNWPSWPYKIARGLEDYPGVPAIPLPITVRLDPTTSAPAAVAQIKALGHAIRRGEVALRPVHDAKGRAIRDARYTGMTEFGYGGLRDFPPNQAWPWVGHVGIVPEPDMTAQLMAASVFPNVPAGVVADYLSVFNRRRRYR